MENNSLCNTTHAIDAQSSSPTKVDAHRHYIFKCVKVDVLNDVTEAIIDG